MLRMCLFSHIHDPYLLGFGLKLSDVSQMEHFRHPIYETFDKQKYSVGGMQIPSNLFHIHLFCICIWMNQMQIF